MDFEQLESIIDEKCKMLILSNPHNPGGVVWEKETLVKLAEICHRNHILVISDEIHSEMVYPHLWKIQREWISYIPGIVKGIGFALQCFTQPGDKIIIQPPVYHPFRLVPEKMQREVVYNPLASPKGLSHFLGHLGLSTVFG